MQRRAMRGLGSFGRIRRACASTAVLGVSMVGSSVAIAGCDSDCTETEGPMTVTPNRQHGALVVHRSCGGAAGAEEDRIFVVDGNNRRELAVRLHHQIGRPELSWTDDDHVQVHIGADANVVEAETSVEGVAVEVVRP